MKAKLIPIRMEVPRLVRGRPSYVWVEGFKLITPDGEEMQPYMRKREAKAFCNAQGWTTVSHSKVPQYAVFDS